MEVVNTARVRQQLSQSEEKEARGEEGGDTWVFPLVQMRPLGIQVDEQITKVGAPPRSPPHGDVISWALCPGVVP